MTASDLPAHVQAELDALGLRQPQPDLPTKRRQHEPQDKWWQRGEECPF